MKGQQLTEGDVVTVCRMLEVRASRRDIVANTELSLHTVQACVEQAAVWWLQEWRRRRQAEELDRLTEPN
jgi:hypothetical protein